jgi:hypothetical protein
VVRCPLKKRSKKKYKFSARSDNIV